MQARAGAGTDPRGSRGGRGLPQAAGPGARQLLARLDARPLAARAAADVAALVRRAGATLRLRPKEAVSVLQSADIEVTDSRLPHAPVVGHRNQHRRSETLGTNKVVPPVVTQGEARCASKPSQASDGFCVELIRGSEGFGLSLSGGRDVVAGDTPLVVRGLLRDGPAQRCGRLQAGDLVLHINQEPTHSLTHAQAVELIRAGGPRLHLVLRRPLETHPDKPEEMAGPRKDGSLDPGGAKVMKSSGASAPQLQHSRSRTTPQTRGSPEASPEAASDGAEVPISGHRPEDPDGGTPGSPGPWLVPSEERLSRALGVPGGAQLALEMAAGRRRH
ncbi:LOW QUALITY PROTEIN: PDZ domain-containing protein MAGIX [Dasypus novemcinctus]|uniref:LOW QUALITY PROTEIN: PDZ domain-containing protein MAGIX n=1 Tax=Dasypus novemcinctus TaxID=9361 RepID=UPI00265DA287|nr:LOW QUALITY PROTEIN: PDZ domain-containing protein MAGIX [Dasypus novemcinctus]